MSDGLLPSNEETMTAAALEAECQRWHERWIKQEDEIKGLRTELAQVKADRDRGWDLYERFRKKYAELRFPGMTGRVRTMGPRGCAPNCKLPAGHVGDHKPLDSPHETVAEPRPAGWTHVSDRRPPDNGELVLVATSTGRVRTTEGASVCSGWRAAQHDKETPYYTHWCALPAAPGSPPETGGKP